MDVAAIKRTSKQYNAAMEAVEEVLVDAMCDMFQEVTGKQASNRLREALHEAVRFNI